MWVMIIASSTAHQRMPSRAARTLLGGPGPDMQAAPP